jgi:hypothetical protein
MRMPFLPPIFLSMSGPLMRNDSRVSHRAGAENEAEILLGHQIAERVFGDVEVVAPHAEERVSHAQRKPVDEAPHHKPAAVSQRVVGKIRRNHCRQAKRDRGRIKITWNHSCSVKKNRATRAGSKDLMKQTATEKIPWLSENLSCRNYSALAFFSAFGAFAGFSAFAALDFSSAASTFSGALAALFRPRFGRGGFDGWRDNRRQTFHAHFQACLLTSACKCS